MKMQISPGCRFPAVEPVALLDKDVFLIVTQFGDVPCSPLEEIVLVLVTPFAGEGVPLRDVVVSGDGVPCGPLVVPPHAVLLLCTPSLLDVVLLLTETGDL